MFKKLIITLSLLTALPVFAGEFESALANKDYVFLYIYTPWCRYCQEFNPIYNKLSKMYDKNYAFVKADGSRQYGYNLGRKFNVRYVPFVVLVNSKTGNKMQIDANCLLATECIEKAINRFKK